MKSTNFTLPHVVLLAKRWYGMSDDLFADLAKMFEMDGYPGYEKDRNGIYLKMVFSYTRWIDERQKNGESNIASLETLLTRDCRSVYKKYNDAFAHQNFTDFMEVIIVAIMLELSQYAFDELPCPEYTAECLPGKVGLLGNFSDWYEDARNKGIKDLPAYFNKRVKEVWK